MGWDGLLLLNILHNNQLKESFTPNKLQNNPENSDTFINKAVLTVASIYYKYNRIPVFYHLPFAFMETN